MKSRKNTNYISLSTFTIFIVVFLAMFNVIGHSQRAGEPDPTFNRTGIRTLALFTTPFSEGSDVLGEVIALPNNRFAAFGSLNGLFSGSWASFEKYNPSGSSTTKHWTWANCDAIANSPCNSTTADLAPNGLIVMGGYNGNGQIMFHGLDSDTWNSQSLWPGFPPIINSSGQVPVAVEWLTENTFVALANAGATPLFRLITVTIGGHVNNDGFVVPVANVSDTTFTGSDMTLQSDGKIVAVGFLDDPGRRKIVIRRYLGGALAADSSFGGTGSVTTDLGANATAKKVAVQADGKILVGCDLEVDSLRQFAVVRYNPDGSLDTAFGVNGVAVIVDGPRKSIVNGLAIQKNGKIVVSGYKGTDGFGAFDYSDFKISRFNADGAIDLNYGNFGTSLFAPAYALVNRSYAMTLDSSDRAVLVGGAGITPFVGRGIVRVLSEDREPPPPTPKPCLDELYDNGPMVTHPGAGAGGADISRVQNSLGLSATGYEATRGNSIADDFTVPEGGWHIDYIKFYSFFASASNATTSTSINSAHVRIWDNSPDNVNANLVWGDLDMGVTNSRISSVFANIYRDTENSPGNTSRPIMEVVAKIDTTLSAGSYWLEIQIESGEAVNGIPFVTILGSPNKPGSNALRKDPYSGIWSPLKDNGSSAAVQDMPFKIYASRPCASSTTAFDFDGDGKADTSVFRPSTGVWYQQNSQTGFSSIQFGVSTDKIVPGDYDGDGKADVAVFRDGSWYWLKSSNGTFSAVQFGLAGDIPVPGDYTGDGKDEVAVYREGIWYSLDLTNGGFQAVDFGIATDRPVNADYDGDGKMDRAVYRDGTWYILGSTAGFSAVQFGISADKTVVGDYDGDGKADPAVYRSGTWYVLGSQQGFFASQFGVATDLPVPADYDGDGKYDFAIYRDGTWWLNRSTSGVTAVGFGLPTDSPIPNAYVR